MPLTTLAQITAVAGKEDLVRAERAKLVDITRAEPGCLQDDPHADNGPSNPKRSTELCRVKALT